MKARTKRKIAYGMPIVLALAISVGCLLFAYWYASNASEERTADIQMVYQVKTNVVTDVVETEIINEVGEVVTEGFDTNLLRIVDFDSLTSINSAATRWIYVPGTGIDSYVMQESTVGVYAYSNADIYGNYTAGGSYLVPADVTDSNGEVVTDDRLLILGHRMSGFSGEWMFSHLPNRWGTISGAQEYPYIYLYYEDRAERWAIWAVADAWATDMIYYMPYSLGTDTYQELIDHVVSLSRYETMETPDSETPLLMLSTCNRDTGSADLRFVVACVPSAVYYYDTSTYVEYDDAVDFGIWLDSTAIEVEEEEDAEEDFEGTVEIEYLDEVETDGE